MNKEQIPLQYKLAAILSVFMLLVPIIIGLRYQEIMQASDFSMTFYVVGNMIAHGQLQDIYPPLQAGSLIHTPFDNYAHQLLDKLPARNVAIYMYSPLTAVLFAPFGLLNPVAALACWQTVIVISALACIPLLVPPQALKSALTRVKLLSWVALFAPLIQQILIGHLSVPLGMLPLSLGYFFLCRGKDFLAGCVFALLFLKPQFLPSALLFIGCYTFTKRFNALLGFLCGSLAITLLTVFALGPETLVHWYQSLKFSDTIFTNPAYNYPHYLAVSIPSVVLQLLPSEQTSMAKLVLYSLAAILGVFTLYVSVGLIKKIGKEQSMPLILVLSILVLPVVLPHFLYYDLCSLICAALVIQSNALPTALEAKFKRLILALYVVINFYFVYFFATNIKGSHSIAPVVLVLFMTSVFALAMHQFAKLDPNSISSVVRTSDETA
ncbi:MAG: glycosyltransferase family 87 protein [Candidatus Melainabacteria bacterium]|nr:glycosyltransferase family 87 protein [Candidatus Melainabacteria bacterium]